MRQGFARGAEGVFQGNLRSLDREGDDWTPHERGDEGVGDLVSAGVRRLDIRPEKDVPKATGADVAPGIVLLPRKGRDRLYRGGQPREEAGGIGRAADRRLAGKSNGLEEGSRVVAEDPIIYPCDCYDYTIGLPCFSKILNAPVPIATRFPSSS